MVRVYRTSKDTLVKTICMAVWSIPDSVLLFKVCSCTGAHGGQLHYISMFLQLYIYGMACVSKMNRREDWDLKLLAH